MALNIDSAYARARLETGIRMTRKDTPIEDGCLVCGPGVPAIEHQIDECMYRTGEVFTYRECSGCGSLQIAAVPADLGQYYDPGKYYSFATRAQRPKSWRDSPAAHAGIRLNTELFLRTGKGKRFGIDFARHSGMRPHHRILDIGCGAGDNLRSLHKSRFRHLAGADPFLEEETTLGPDVPLLKRFHADLVGEYDWVMMHHAFEHVPDPRATLQSALRLLAPKGRVLIRMPIMGQEAWHRYGVNWVQIDPPRHLAVYTLDAVHRLAAEEGFEVTDIYFDSKAFQFWGSELAVRKLPFATDGSTGVFSESQMLAWSREAEELNRRNAGDQAGIILTRTA